MSTILHHKNIENNTKPIKKEIIILEIIKLYKYNIT